MSNEVNDKLFEDAEAMCDYWLGTMHERVIRRDIEADDLDALKYHVDQAWREMVLQETYQPSEEVSDVS